MPVYLIRAGLTGPVKIGKADDPRGRRSELQVAHYEELHLLRAWVGGLAEELRLHDLFADLRIRGEWFSFSKLMLGDVGVVEIDLTPAPLSFPVVEACDGRLAQYLSEKRLSVSQFGRSIGVENHMTVYRYIKGLRFPPPLVLKRIREVTDGLVTADDFVQQHTAAKPESPPQVSAA